MEKRQGFGGVWEACRVPGRVPAGERERCKPLGGECRAFWVVEGRVRGVFGGAVEGCRMAGGVTAGVGEVLRRVRSVGRGEGRVHGMAGLRDGEVGVVGCRDRSAIREVGVRICRRLVR